MAKELSRDAIASGSGRTWDEWVAYFESMDADALSHQELVTAASKAGAPPWWRQMIAVRYEQHIGRRAPGQDCDGNFSVSVSKTYAASLDDALRDWTVAMASRADLSGIEVTRGPDVSETEKWRYWRVGLADGSRVVVNISARSSDKSVISVQHEKLESDDEVDHWRSYWKSVLQEV